MPLISLAPVATGQGHAEDVAVGRQGGFEPEGRQCLNEAARGDQFVVIDEGLVRPSPVGPIRQDDASPTALEFVTLVEGADRF
ncbi:MAG: hypothetical protein M3524_09305 [Actinomycetota bacterium]|nr:hypothetical protein [Actinomycetota bacterium]